jgi:hypothetical protein
MRPARQITACCVVVAGFAAPMLRAQKFVPGCSLPDTLAAIKEQHPIDKSCTKNGLSKVNEKVLESRAKNNLCATGPETVIEYETLTELQQAIDNDHFPLGNRNTPARPTKKYASSKGDLGEGDLVSLVAWVLLAKNSNRSSGENVNCKKSGIENNDIHIVLAKFVDHADLDEDEANSVTAEAIPHLRPSSWSAANINSFHDHPFRFTGPLFLDSDHEPSRADGTGGGPDRASVWELHPVYNIEICKFTSKTKCDPATKKAWVTLDDWAGQQTDQ